MKKHLHRHKATIFSLSLLACVIVVGFTISEFRKADIAQAGVTDNFTGFAWSDMPNGSDEVINPTGLTVGRGAGWISFNSIDISSGVDYGVNVDSSGNITGNAWSENVGWITFNVPSGCPGAMPCAPKINLTTGAFSGWARALASSDAQAGGWDGWIALANNGFVGPTFGVTVNTATGDASGYAWGGDVLGWINFTGVHIVLPPLLPPLTLVANPTSVYSTNPLETDLTYASPAGTAFTSCSFASSPTSTSVNGDTMPADHPLPTVANQTIVGVSVVAPSTTYTLTCTGTGIPTATATATVTVLNPTPIASLTGPSCVQTAGTSAQLIWASSNVTGCSITPSIGTVPVSGSQATVINSTTTFDLACTGPYGSAHSSHTVTVNPTCVQTGAGGPVTPIFQEV